MKILVVLPTYNESENIKRLIKQILQLPFDIEILVIDDNSPDGTARIVKEISAVSSKVHLLVRYNQKGRGSAGIAGFKKAFKYSPDYVIEMDADFSHLPQQIPNLIRAIKNYDLVIGSRFVKGGYQTGRPFYRIFISLLANFFLRKILNVKPLDCTTGFRCYKLSALEKINFNNLKSTGPSIVFEILYYLQKENCKIKEVPIIYQERKKGKSKLNYKILLQCILFAFKLRLKDL